MASVRQLTKANREGKRPWVVEYTDASGKRRRATPASGLKKDADKLRQKIEREIEDGGHVAASETMTVKALSEEYLRALECRLRDGEISLSHHDNVKAGIVHHVVPRLGRLLVSELKPNDVRQFYEHMRSKMSAYSAKKRITQLVMLETFAVQREYAKSAVAKGVASEFRPRRVPVRTFTMDEITRLLKAADERCRNKTWATKRNGRALHMTRIFVHLAAFCGLRRGEIEALSWPHVDLNARVLRVRHSLSQDGKVKGPKTKAGLRDVPIPLHLAQMIREWRERFFVANQEDFVLQSIGGKPVRAASFNYNNWLPLLQAAGIELNGDTPHFHALRHFAASLMIENGIAITEVASLLGHAHVDMTLQVYAHPIVGGHRRSEAVDRMAAAVLAEPGTIELGPLDATRLPAPTRSECDFRC